MSIDQSARLRKLNAKLISGLNRRGRHGLAFSLRAENRKYRSMQSMRFLMIQLSIRIKKSWLNTIVDIIRKEGVKINVR